MNLLEHPFWGVTDPGKMRLVRTYDVPPEMNPFAKDGVILRVAAAPGEVPYHKWPMAREAILDGVRRGVINEKTVIVEATSGNTGHAMATICTVLGLQFVPILGKDIPGSKVDIIRALGEHVSVQTPNPGETTVDAARRLGGQEGWYNPDQYAGEWNPRSHEEHLAPQIFSRTPVSVFVAPGGTMGTCIGIARYARAHGLRTNVVPVLCARGQEVPAARTLERVERDIRLPWQDYVADARGLQFGTRTASFTLSFLSWRFLPVQLGPSFGLAFAGALLFLEQELTRLDRLREKDGKVYVVIFGPDDYRPYNSLYLAQRLYDGEYADRASLDLLKLAKL